MEDGETLKIKIRRLPHCFSLPQYDTLDSTGLDLYAAISDLMLLQPNEEQSIPTGIAIALPKGYEGQIRSKGSMVTSHVTIDSNSKEEEIKVVLVNTGKNTLEILPGAVIAHIVIMKYIRITWDEDCSGVSFAERRQTKRPVSSEAPFEKGADGYRKEPRPTGTGLPNGALFGKAKRDVLPDENTLQRLRISLANFDSLGADGDRSLLPNGDKSPFGKRDDINEAKNVLQELLVKHKIPLPKYEYNFIGPSNNRTFKGTVTIEYSPTDTMIVTGDEKYTKKDAEKSAALNALKKLKGVYNVNDL